MVAAQNIYSYLFVLVSFRTELTSPLCPSVRNASPQSRPGRTTAASATRKRGNGDSQRHFCIFTVGPQSVSSVCVPGVFWRWTTTVVSFCPATSNSPEPSPPRNINHAQKEKKITLIELDSTCSQLGSTTAWATSISATSSPSASTWRWAASTAASAAGTSFWMPTAPSRWGVAGGRWWFTFHSSSFSAWSLKVVLFGRGERMKYLHGQHEIWLTSLRSDLRWIWF